MGRVRAEANAEGEAARSGRSCRSGTPLERLLRRAAVVSGIGVVVLAGALLLPWAITAGTSSHASRTPVADPTSRADMIRTLESLLPAGEFTDRLGRGLGEGFDPYAHVVYDDGSGPAAVSVSFIDWLEPGVQAEMTIGCPTKDPTYQFDSCVVSRLPDGSRLTLFKGYSYPDRRVDTRFWSASLLTPSSQYISVSEWNSVADHGSPITRAQPPLSGDQLKQVVTAAPWRRVVAALGEDKKKRTVVEEPCRRPSPDVNKVLDTFVRLLPKGVEVVERDGGDGHVVVDDGKGRSYVRVDVRYCMGVDEEVTRVYDGSEHLPDGTMIAERRGPDGQSVKGNVMWTVDTMGGGGLRIVLSACNAASEDGAPSRPAPALTWAQLRTISLSPKWDPFRS
ncbi:hypothetical protein [Streptomyces sp. NPDC002265]|uniref:hypothetical protein n=1 Tax=Streptomyces sp. NPDC002265 TaxID=3154415 RepID=UPI0033346162